MALTAFQRHVCRLLADRRIAGGERYVAGGLALNALLGGKRVSRDVDLFHDTDEALAVSFGADVDTLARAGLTVLEGRRSVGFSEVLVRSDDGETLEIQWVRDSAYRFFPLLTHEELGLVLHPFDLATNKVLALVGRVAARDWVDILTCHQELASLGCLAWAASGKDPGLGPRFIVEEAARTARYSAVEFDQLRFEGPPPDRGVLAQTWRAALYDARQVCDLLDPRYVGRAVLDADGVPFRGEAGELTTALARGALVFHEGTLGGAFPMVRSRPGGPPPGV